MVLQTTFAGVAEVTHAAPSLCLAQGGGEQGDTVCTATAIDATVLREGGSRADAPRPWR